jgi:hypothetical protein
MAPLYYPITGDVAKADSDQQLDDTAQMPVLPSKPLVLPSQLLPNAANDQSPNPLPFLGANFDVTLYANASDFTRPERGLDHSHTYSVPTGESVIDNAAVFDDSGRSFHGYKEGKYFMPNDGVNSINPNSCMQP